MPSLFKETDKSPGNYDNECYLWLIGEKTWKKRTKILGHVGVNYLLVINNQHVELEQGRFIGRSLI